MVRQRILIIEDDKEMVALGQLILEKEGYRVLAANDGQTGLDMLASQPIDLVLLDIMMSPMDGWEVLERIKADAQLAHIPVIMLTARHYLEDHPSAHDHAHLFASYVVKPFVVSNLLYEIQGVLVDAPPNAVDET
jgi:CheY-like chemotaxis protein